jgi:replicative DNA helicase
LTLRTIDEYGPGFQIKVLSSLLTYKEFLTNIYDILNEEDFTNNAHRWIVQEILKYYNKYHCPPSLDILKVEVKKIDNEVLKLSVKEHLREAYITSDEDLKYVQEEFSTFCKNQQLKKALLSSVDLLKAGDYDSIKIMVENALKAGQDKNIGHEYNLDIETRYQENNRKSIPTPWTQVNELLQGGLGNGDFGLIFGNPGGGKSWSLVALGGHAIRMGYNVLHYTLELGEDYVGRRYDAFFTQIPANNITQHREQIEEIVPQLPGKLIIKEFPMGKTSIHTVESHIRKCNDLNIKPDLIIIDYVDLLSSRKKNVDRKYEIDDIYTNTKGLARELDLPIWSVSQVNRAGAKDNVIEGDKSAGSYDKIMITDFCMSLSRKSKDKINGTGRFHIMKNRYGMDGMSYNVKADTSIGKFDIVSDYDEDDEIISNMPSSNPHSNLDTFDKTQLQKQFFNLNS